MKRFVLTLTGFIVAIVLSLAWYQSVHAPVGSLVPITLTSPDGEVVKLQVEVADDNQERMTGLMDRSSLPEGQGMVFVFDEPGQLGFWMKHTLIPLDILYFDGEGKFVSRTTMIPCAEDPCSLYASQGPSQYALEVNASEPVTLEVGSGWKIETDMLK